MWLRYAAVFCFYFRNNNARTFRKTAHTRAVQWFGDTRTNTSHLTVSFAILGKNSGVLDLWNMRKATCISCAKLRLHHKNNYEIKKNCTFSRKDISITKMSQAGNSNQSKHKFSLKIPSVNFFILIPFFSTSSREVFSENLY